MSEHDGHELEEREGAAGAPAPAPEAAASEGTRPPAPAAPSPPAEAGIRLNDRVIVFGASTTGKSELINHLFTTFRCQELLADTKGHEFDVVGDDGEIVAPVSDVAAIDWRQRIIQYVDRTGEAAEFDELFAALNGRRNVIAFVHELADLCEYQPNRTGRQVRAYFNKGATSGRGAVGGSQRTVYVPLHARTEAMHAFHMVPRLADDDDHRAAARAMHLHPNELAGRLADLQSRYGDYAFLWANRRTREVRDCPPLPEHVRAHTIVHRR